MPSQNMELLKASGMDGRTGFTPIQIVKAARSGIKMKVVKMLAENLGLKLSDIGRLLSISTRTLQRYDAERSLPTDISEHVLLMIKVFDKATDVFDDQKQATEWIKSDSIALGNHSPLDYLDTLSGTEMVYDELIRIEHGVYA